LTIIGEEKTSAKDEEEAEKIELREKKTRHA